MSLDVNIFIYCFCLFCFKWSCYCLWCYFGTKGSWNVILFYSILSFTLSKKKNDLFHLRWNILTANSRQFREQSQLYGTTQNGTQGDCSTPRPHVASNFLPPYFFFFYLHLLKSTNSKEQMAGHIDERRMT